MREKLLKKINKLYLATKGFYLFHFQKKKELVYIVSTMRAGSTLLKALLGQADDVSHIEEKEFELVSKYKFFNKYLNYYKAYHSSYEHRIIVYKTPASSLDQIYSYPYLPLDQVKLILLTRNPNDIVKSLVKMSSEFFIYREKESAKKYVHLVFKRMSQLNQDNSLQIKLVSYENLIREPEAISLDLLKYIDSSSKQGFCSYDIGDAKWKWGSDDQSDKIYSREVLNDSNIFFIPSEVILNLASCSVDSETFFRKINYFINNKE